MLSEGVNLQQAGRIVNYDLPWNPMRLVQRHGRIDRIGSRHREVHLGCFFPATHLDELLGLEETIQRKIAYAAVSVGIGDVIPGQKAKRIEVVLADNREQIETLREERPELFESGGDSAALSGEEYRRRLELALEDGLVGVGSSACRWARGPASGPTLATEHGWVFATEVGPEREARLAFVAATPFWEVRRDDDGLAEVDESPLRCLSDADPGDRSTYAELPTPAYDGVFDAWPEARRAIWRSWMRLTDPANLQPDVKGVLRRAADLVRDTQSPHQTCEPRRRRPRPAVAASDLARGRADPRRRRSDSPRDRALRDLVDAEGLQAPPPPEPLPPITEDEIRLVAWMAVIPERD